LDRDSSVDEFWNTGTYWSLGHAPLAGRDRASGPRRVHCTVLITAHPGVREPDLPTENLSLSAGTLTFGTGRSTRRWRIRGTLNQQRPADVTNLSLSKGQSTARQPDGREQLLADRRRVNIGGAAEHHACERHLTPRPDHRRLVFGDCQAGSVAVNGALASSGTSSSPRPAQSLRCDDDRGQHPEVFGRRCPAAGACGQQHSHDGRRADRFDSNKLNVILNSDRDASGVGAISLGSGTVITSNGGDITLGGGADPLATAAFGTASNIQGININNAQLRAGAGAINLRGQGYGSGSSNVGVYLQNGAIVEASSGNITLNGTGGGSGSGQFNFGVSLEVRLRASPPRPRAILHYR